MPDPSRTQTAPAGRQRESLLRLSSVCVRFGGVRALVEVDLSVDKGEIVGLIGPNGAGKTTLLNCISRLQSIDSGTITFAEQGLPRAKPSALAGKGIARTLQHVSLASDMTVLENVLVGAYPRGTTGVIGNLVGLPSARRERVAMLEESHELLTALGLADYGSRLAASLPVVLQRRVDVARALISKPALLLMDEPAAGLNDAELNELGSLISSLPADYEVSGVLLVEHHVGLVMEVCDRVAVLNFGKKIADGDPTSVQGSAEVQSAYLGAPSRSNDSDEG